MWWFFIPQIISTGSRDLLAVIWKCRWLLVCSVCVSGGENLEYFCLWMLTLTITVFISCLLQTVKWWICTWSRCKTCDRWRVNKQLVNQCCRRLCCFCTVSTSIIFTLCWSHEYKRCRFLLQLQSCKLTSMFVHAEYMPNVLRFPLCVRKILHILYCCLYPHCRLDVSKTVSGLLQSLVVNSCC